MQQKRKNIQKTISISGFVEEYDSIEDGIGVLISAEDDENYVVVPDKNGKKLSQFVDEKVKVTGMVSKDRDGLKYITVNSFKVYEDPPEYDDYDNDDDRYDTKDLNFDD